jgi:hypothetical protein
MPNKQVAAAAAASFLVGRSHIKQICGRFPDDVVAGCHTFWNGKEKESKKYNAGVTLGVHGVVRVKWRSEPLFAGNDLAGGGKRVDSCHFVRRLLWKQQNL